MQFTHRTLAKIKNIALVAHDNCKDDLISWCLQNKDLLSQHHLWATGTSGHLVNSRTGLKVKSLLSGPMGGDQQLGGLIATKQIDLMIFFWDPMNAAAHDPDVKALMRVSTVWNIPMAMNRASADFLITSPLFSQEFDVDVPDYESYINKRTAEIK